MTTAGHSVTGSPAFHSDSQPCMRCCCCLAQHSSAASLSWAAAVLCAQDAVQGGDPGPSSSQDDCAGKTSCSICRFSFLFNSSGVVVLGGCFAHLCHALLANIEVKGPSTCWVLRMCVGLFVGDPCCSMVWMYIRAWSACPGLASTPAETHTAHIGPCQLAPLSNCIPMASAESC